MKTEDAMLRAQAATVEWLEYLRMRTAAKLIRYRRSKK